MSDNRNFVNKFANQGGGDIYVEDAKLSEISTKTAIASEGVMLKGTDGAYYEIDKASLSEVVRAELGAILADNSHDNGTSVAKVPTLNSTDNVLGSSSIANLASVLGGEIGVNLFNYRSKGLILNLGSGYYLVIIKLAVSTIPANNGYTISQGNIIDLGDADKTFSFDYCPQNTENATLAYSASFKGFNIVNNTSGSIGVPTNNLFIAVIH